MRLCQVGCGEHARVAHGPSQARCARERADLVLAGCCDLDAARAEAFRRDFGYGQAFTDPRAMLEAERPDAVVVVVPVERTVAVGSMVLERGLPLLLEKPPGETVAEVDRLIAAAERGGAACPTRSRSTAASPRWCGSCGGGSGKRGRCSTSTTR